EGALAADTSPGTFLARIDEVCERVLSLGQRPRLLRLDDLRPLLDRVAHSVCPLFCGGGAPPSRLVRLPRDFRAVLDLGEYEGVVGNDGEVVFALVQHGVT